MSTGQDARPRCSVTDQPVMKCQVHRAPDATYVCFWCRRDYFACVADRTCDEHPEDQRAA